MSEVKSERKEISVQRALTELKGILRKIQMGSYGIKSAVMVFPGKNIEGLYTPTEFKAKGKSDMQSVEDLFKRHAALKGAIYTSNATTKVTINGEEMTVADAIVRRENSPQELDFYNGIKNQIRTEKAKFEKEVERQKFTIENGFSEALKKGGDQAESAKKLMAEQLKMVSPSLELIITEADLETKISNVETFLQEVDTVLSESNALTKISI